MSPAAIASLSRSATKWAGRLVVALMIGVLALAASQVLIGRYQVHPVLTGSMRPGFSLGSVVVVKKVPATSLHVRDVLLFHKPTNPSDYVVHRIVSIRDTAAGKVIQTKGDDNPVKDPWTFTLKGRTAYTAQFTVPYLGYAALWLHQPRTRHYAVFAAAILLLFSAASVLLKKETAVESAPDEEPTGARHRASHA
jgi:signal peptidase I